MVGFASSPRFVEHDTGPHHPERPDRIRAIHKAVRDAGLIDSSNPFPEFVLEFGLKCDDSLKLVELDVTPAGEDLPLLVHPREYVDRIKHICQIGGGVLDQGDTPVAHASFDIALLSLGSAVAAADAVMNQTVQRAFSAARPPGHHAEPDRPMGFCLFSNIAIVARYVQKKYNIARIAIVDFDVHHGNGTQAAFEDDPRVLFVSLHQDPRTCYPGSGYAYETGVGAGEGFTLNIPISPGADDDDYSAAIDSQVLPKLDSFNPELLLLSAGFDGHRDDPLANVNLSEAGFAQITRRLCEAADRHCGGRVVSLLEGGYNLRALGRCVVAHLRAMTET